MVVVGPNGRTGSNDLVPKLGHLAGAMDGGEMSARACIAVFPEVKINEERLQNLD